MKRVTMFSAAITLLLAAIAIAWFFIGTRTGSEAPAITADDPGAEWQARIGLEQLAEINPRHESSRLTITLRNAKGKEIETPHIAFEVNGKSLTYRVAQGNYYDRHPYYTLREEDKPALTADTPYEIVIRRSTDTVSPFAGIRTPSPMQPAHFQVPGRHPGDRDLVITWNGLRQQADLLIYRTRTLADAQGNQTIEAGGPYAEDALRHTIGPDEATLREGRYVIPAAYFAASAGGPVSTLTLEAYATNSGKFQHPVLKGSTITAQRKIVFRIDIMEAKMR